MQNPAVPFWDEGNTITAQAAVAITGKRFVRIAGPRVNEQVRVNHGASAVAGRAFGVSGFDAAVDALVSCYTAPGLVMPVTAAVALAAGAEVFSTADGRATNVAPVAGARPEGIVLDDAAVGADALVKLL